MNTLRPLNMSKCLSVKLQGKISAIFIEFEPIMFYAYFINNLWFSGICIFLLLLFFLFSFLVNTSVLFGSDFMVHSANLNRY